MSRAPELSVVLISRDQVWNIARLIRSVKSQTHGIHTEVILVDSASTDGTTQVALDFGIRVIQLKPNQHLSPSTGRFIGYEMTSGVLVLFLDGDAELFPSWLEVALPLIRDPDIAGITGNRVTLPPGIQRSDKPNVPVRTEAAYQTSRIGGSALYRRSALEQAGQFDPYLFSEEEPELCLRLSEHNFMLLKTDYPIIYDYTAPPDAVTTVLSRRQRRLYVGTGQIIRKHWRKPIMLRYLRERLGLFVSFLAAIIWATSLLLLLAIGHWLALFLLSGLPFMALFGITLMRGPRSALVSMVRWACHFEGTIRGLLIKPRFARLADFDYDLLE